MITVHQGYDLAYPSVAGMFTDRKRLFIDLLGWDLPISHPRFEFDQFDGPHATYLIASDLFECHRGSIRLLPTTRRHLLGDVFPQLCDHDPPTGADVREITRLCLPPRIGRDARRTIRNELISAMVDHALRSGIAVLIGVVTAQFRAEILAMGWVAVPLGPTQRVAGQLLGAFRLEIDQRTPSLLSANGIYKPPHVADATKRQAA